MTEIATNLTAAEADYLVQCEETISHGLQTFIEVGTALAMIRDNRLYRAEHPTFEAYCAERWGFTDRRARQLIDAAAIGTIVPVTNEGQARELARVPETERAEVWQQTVERTDGKPTAAAIRETYENTQTPAPMPEPEPASSTSAGSGHNHPADLPGEADARPAATDADPVAREAPAEFPSSAGAGDPLPAGIAAQIEQRIAEKVRADRDLDDPEAIEAAHRQRSSESVATALVSLFMRLDPDPVRWLTTTWQPEAYRLRDMPRVRDVFTTTGLRTIAKHLDTIADHLDRTGETL